MSQHPALDSLFQEARNRAAEKGLTFSAPLLDALAERPDSLTALREGLHSAIEWQLILIDLLRAAQQSLGEPHQDWMARYTRALVRGDMDVCAALISQSPLSPETLSLFEQGTRAYRENRLGEMLPLLEHLQQQPDLSPELMARLLIFSARSRLRLGSPDRAEADLSRARSLAPDLWLVEVAQGDQERRSNNPSKALDIYQTILKRPLEMRHLEAAAGAHIGLALLAEDRGDWGEATTHFEEAIKLLGAGERLVMRLESLAPDESGSLYLSAAYALEKINDEESLRAVNEAIRLGVRGAVQRPDRAAYRLKGDILRDSAPADSALAYIEAARGYAETNEWREAGALYEAALNVLPIPEDQTERTAFWSQWEYAFWNGADAFLVASYAPNPPYVDRAMLDKSVELYQRGMNIGQPGEHYTWVYTLRTRQLMQMAQLKPPPRPRLDLLWEGLAVMERGVMLRDQDAYAWMGIGQSFLQLAMDVNGYAAVRRAYDLSPQDTWILGELTIAAANTGDFERARKTIGELLEVDTKPETEDWCDAVNAFLLAHEGAYQQALDLADALITSGKDYPWLKAGQSFVIDIKAGCLAALGQWEQFDAFVTEQARLAEAEEDKPGTSVDERRLGYLYLIARKFDKAERYLLLALENADSEYLNINLNLAQIALIRGDLARANGLFEKYLQKVRGARHLIDFLNFDLPTTARFVKDMPHGESAAQTIQNWREAGQRRLVEVRANPLSALDELQEALADANDQGWRRIALWCSLGRTYTESGVWREAALAYAHLKPFAENSVPEAVPQYQKVMQNWRSQTDSLIQERDFESARAELAAQERLEDDPLGKSAVQLRQACVQMLISEPNQSRFEAALQLLEQAGWDELHRGAAVGTVSALILPDVESYWRFQDHFAAWGEESRPLVWKAAQTGLKGYLDRVFQLSPAPTPPPPSLKPIAVELGQNLITEELARSTGPVFTTYLPRLRQEIQERFGMLFHGITLREYTTSDPDGYLIRIDENPIAVGHAPANKRFCTASPSALADKGIAVSAADEQVNPLTGASGCWLSEAHWEQALSAGFTLWEDANAYLIYHLQTVIERFLPRFVTPDEIPHYILNQWEGRLSDSTLISRALPRPELHYELCLLLRQLLAAGYSIRDGETILKVVIEVGLEDLPHAFSLCQERLSKVGGMPDVHA
ncbi:hypothetical protein ANRL4_04010 [Anaerolineae bacterium]|nr:hypothetical protein ANRL4_04010 [Anaerolineae bacterium]